MLFFFEGQWRTADEMIARLTTIFDQASIADDKGGRRPLDDYEKGEVLRRLSLSTIGRITSGVGV